MAERHNLKVRKLGPLLKLVWLGFGSLACSSSLPEPRTLPVSAAPAELMPLRIHVFHATMSGATKAGEDVNWLTIWTRAGVQRTMQRAGYVIVVNPKAPADLRAYIDVDWQFGEASVAAMSLKAANGQRVTQLSALIKTPSDADRDEAGMIALVEAMANSPQLRSFARERRGLTLATDADGGNE